MNKIRLCILFGGKSSEYEVSLSSAYGVITNLNKDKYDVVTVGITKDGRWYVYSGGADKIRDGSWCADTSDMPEVCFDLSGSRSLIKISGDRAGRIPVDVVFPVMHGAYSEDGIMQGVLAMSGIPFVGSGCASSAVCMDKAFTKQILNDIGINQAEALIFTRYGAEKDHAGTLSAVENKFDYPVFVKPANAGSSVGVSKAKSRGELETALENAFKIDSKVLVEEFIDGREIEVAVLGNESPEASCPGEINPNSDFYDYETKYISDTASYFIPARLDESVADEVRKTAVKIYTSLSCRGLSRVDFFVTADNRIYFNEINTLPGFTPISMYPKLFINSGISYSELIDRLIELAAE